MLSRAIVDFCWSMVIHILRQLIFAIVKRWWFFVAWTLFLASVQLEFQLYGIFVLKWTQSCVKIRVRESKCRAVKRINQAENREKSNIRTRKHTTGRPNSKFSIAWYQKWTERINTGNFSTRCDFTDLALYTQEVGIERNHHAWSNHHVNKARLFIYLEFLLSSWRIWWRDNHVNFLDTLILCLGCLCLLSIFGGPNSCEIFAVFLTLRT